METQMMIYSEKADSTDIRLILSRYLEPLILRGLMEPISRTIVNHSPAAIRAVKA